MPGTVNVEYERTLDHAVDAAYGWLTDYADDDPQRTDAVIVERPVLERTKDKVVLQATVEITGQRRSGRAEVDLMPPDRWRARIVDGAGRGSVYEYELTPLGPDQCRLHVTYRFYVHRWRNRIKLQLGRRRIAAHLDRMWDGFIASMGEELAVTLKA